MYDYIFITLDSSFYKVNLYNELSKKMKIFVIFLCTKNKNRSEDFLNHKKNFENIYLSDSTYEERNKLENCIQIFKILKGKEYKKLVLGGWDSPENWLALMKSPKKKNCLVVESSEFESTNKGIKGLIKKFFVSKLSFGFASGESQKNLLLNLNYEGKIIKTKGVGIFNLNRTYLPTREIKEVKNFIFVGGLIPVKNVEQIIRIFNELPNLNLNIVGKGPLEEDLRTKAKDNIKFIGHVSNDKLSEIYQQNDVFILPSKSEPWGLVVEEALYNGLPVILSNKIGCASEVIEDGVHGLIYNVDSDQELKEKILKITDLENYKNYKKNVDRMDFEKIKEEQIRSYVN